LAVAHQRSGLFVEAQPGLFAFSHQNFREYLAATALIERLDAEMAQSVLTHAEDPWWEEVILLAAAHPNLSSRRREFLLEHMREAGHLVLAGRCAVDAGARLATPLHRQLKGDLHQQMTNADLSPKERYAAGEVLDELGWLPPDLNAWVRCPGSAEDGPSAGSGRAPSAGSGQAPSTSSRRDLMVMKYPLTNIQYERFIQAGGYENSDYWGGEKSEDWKWRVKESPDYRGEDPVAEPHYWHNPRFGRERHSHPVVGISWYEAMACAAWLTEMLGRLHAGKDVSPEDQALVADLLETGTSEVRLLTEAEWVSVAGGTGAEDRYPWDSPDGPATGDGAVILARANIYEADLGGTSPVAMYPLGASQPFGLSDLAGNVWEWARTIEGSARVVRGGSWFDHQDFACVAARNWFNPNYSLDNVGVRLASPVLSSQF
jgi:formylglycine-generating enzyme required for sulfatase activity